MTLYTLDKRCSQFCVSPVTLPATSDVCHTQSGQSEGWLWGLSPTCSGLDHPCCDFSPTCSKTVMRHVNALKLAVKMTGEQCVVNKKLVIFEAPKNKRKPISSGAPTGLLWEAYSDFQTPNSWGGDRCLSPRTDRRLWPLDLA